jgi:hypothetical protein
VEPSRIELARLKTFIGMQMFFLFATPFAGGGRFRIWSMLDTAVLVLSIGLTALAFVLESRRGRSRVFHAAAALYLFGIFDMALNILIFGVLGWKKLGNLF